MKPNFILALTIWFAALIAGPAIAQTPEADRGFLVGLLEDNLSGAGRVVQIEGFAGALSARATIDTLTIADSSGVWFTMSDAVMDWDRSALLSGRLQITELSAAEVIVSRKPVLDPELPKPEAAGFSLPVLPGSVDIERIGIARLSLSETLFGQGAIVALAGSMQLSGGAGATELAINRIDGSTGSLALTGSYSNSTRQLAVSLLLDEANDGIVANLLDLPGLPSVQLDLAGAAPIDEFTANVTLATDGERRLAGQVALSAQPESDAPGAPITRAFGADIGGNLAPVFLPKYQSFFGPDVRLKLRGQRAANGQLHIDDLSLNAQAIVARGQMVFAPNGWPQRLAITGRIGAADGSPVLLPLPNGEKYVTAADFMFAYDEVLGETWSSELTLSGLSQADLKLQKVQLKGTGELSRGDNGKIGRGNGKIDLRASNIAFADPAMADAIGETLAGNIDFEWSDGAPLKLENLDLSGSHYGLKGNVNLSGLTDRLNLLATGAVTLYANDLTRFAALAKMDIGGAAELNIGGSSAFLGGEFDLKLAGSTRDLQFGNSLLDPLLLGPGEVSLSIARDATGTRLPNLDVSAAGLQASAFADVKSGGTSASFALTLPDLQMLDVNLAGAAKLRGRAVQLGTKWDIDISGAGPGAATAKMLGTAVGETLQSLTVESTLQATVANLTPYSRLAGRDLAGGAGIGGEARYETASGNFSSKLDIEGANLAVGQSHLDQLLAGKSTLKIQARRETPDLIVFDQIDVVTPQMSVDITGSVGPSRSRLRFHTAMNDFGLFAQDFNGPLNADGVIEKTDSEWQIEVNSLGRGGTTLRSNGIVSVDGHHLNLKLQGAVPLAIANRYVKPRSLSGMAQFDLRLFGPPKISSLSGEVSTVSGSAILPNYRIALVDMTARANIVGGTATLNATAKVSTGGTTGLSGSVNLTAPFPADLTLSVRQMAVADPRLFETVIDGQVDITGPLGGGAGISGDLTLGQVDVQVRDAGPAAAAFLPDLQHANEPAAVHRTREFANLIDDSGSQIASGVDFPVDIILRAPSRIFVRGRGLDAELGGTLRLLGTTNNLIPQGQFDLIRGRLDILGKRLNITEGFARIQGSFDPYVRLVAETQAEEVSVSILVEGLASAPVVSFQSNPELPEDEVLSLLLFGRGINKISAFQAAQLASAANTLVGNGGGGVVNRLRDQFGLDDLDVVTGDNGAVGARVGKYITENIYSDVTVDSEGKSQINLNIQMSPSVTARGRLDSSGDTGIGLFIEKDY